MVFVTFGVSDVLVYMFMFMFMFYLCCLKLGHIQEIPKQVWKYNLHLVWKSGFIRWAWGEVNISGLVPLVIFLQDEDVLDSEIFQTVEFTFACTCTCQTSSLLNKSFCFPCCFVNISNKSKKEGSRSSFCLTWEINWVLF